MALDGWKEKLFRQYLRLLCRPSRVRKHLASRVKKAEGFPPVDRRKVVVAALQLEIKLVKEPLDYVEEMERRVREAAAAGARLAVFPEYNNLPLLGMLPGIEEAEGGAGAGGGGGADITVADIIRYAGPVMEPLIRETFSVLARAYRLYLMAGSFLLSEGGRVVNRAFLYGPGGELVGVQDKVHLMPVEGEWGVDRGRHFALFDTALGRLAMPVCMDATYFETFRILERRGAEIVMSPIANPEPYNYWLALRGIWPRVQESPVYGIKSALVGKLAGFVFTGRAGVFAPLELTAAGDGVLAEVAEPDREGMAVAALDLEALEELRAHHPWRDTNEKLYKRYFPRIYRNIEERVE